MVQLLNAIHLREFQAYYKSLSERQNFVVKDETKTKTEKSTLNNSLLDSILEKIEENSVQFNNKKSKPKILVVAQSNAAVDEIITRVMTKQFTDAEMTHYLPDIIRVGKTTSPLVNKRSLDTLIQAYKSQQDINTSFTNWKNHVNSLSRARVDILNQMEVQGVNENLIQQFLKRHEDRERSLLELYRITILCQAANAIEEEKKKGTKTSAKRILAEEKKLQQLLEQSLVASAEIVFATISGSAMECFSGPTGQSQFDYVIVDEAAQAVEVATLIPMQYNCKVCILVGDPQQLPATLFSQEAKKYLYDQSLFQRLAKCKFPVNLLNTQYRMHPAISSFPSSYFYSSALLDGANVTSEAYNLPVHNHFKPLSFFSAIGREQRTSGGSKSNQYEAQFCLKLYQNVLELYPEMEKRSFGVITPYGQQLALLKTMFGGYEQVEVNTVDAFQGREKDFIIFSCVRTDGIGFLSDIRRMNVALTRGKYGMWVVGNENLLCKNPAWSDFIDYTVENNYFNDRLSPFLMHPPRATTPNPQQTKEKITEVNEPELIQTKPPANINTNPKPETETAWKEKISPNQSNPEPPQGILTNPAPSNTQLEEENKEEYEEGEIVQAEQEGAGLNEKETPMQGNALNQDTLREFLSNIDLKTLNLEQLQAIAKLLQIDSSASSSTTAPTPAPIPQQPFDNPNEHYSDYDNSPRRPFGEDLLNAKNMENVLPVMGNNIPFELNQLAELAKYGLLPNPNVLETMNQMQMFNAPPAQNQNMNSRGGRGRRGRGGRSRGWRGRGGRAEMERNAPPPLDPLLLALANSGLPQLGLPPNMIPNLNLNPNMIPNLNPNLNPALNPNLIPSLLLGLPPQNPMQPNFTNPPFNVGNPNYNPNHNPNYNPNRNHNPNYNPNNPNNPNNRPFNQNHSFKRKNPNNHYNNNNNNPNNRGRYKKR
uniref:Helicase ATP-binding domain-containing protein n=1 Tax=Arcella intermedia TaxID=1963864 RepID=A0A6B2KXA7_9EUKA